MRTVNKFVLKFLLLSCCHGAIAQSTLTCSVGNHEIVRPQSKDEASRIVSSPHPVGRSRKHEIDVSWLKGVRRFADEPPYDEDLDGVWWAYCGYSKTLKVHLLMEQKIDVFTGVLLDDKTGKLIPGGEIVLFSPNGQRYLAFEQPDGQDGATIKLCTRKGVVLWQGFNGILASDGISIDAEIKDIRWTSNNELTADAVPSQGSNHRVRLVESKPGKWQWK